MNNSWIAASSVAPADLTLLLVGQEGHELGLPEAMLDGAAVLHDGIVSSRADASPVRIWPHHFDITNLITFHQDAEGKAPKTVGIGFVQMSRRRSQTSDRKWSNNTWRRPPTRSFLCLSEPLRPEDHLGPE